MHRPTMSEVSYDIITNSSLFGGYIRSLRSVYQRRGVLGFIFYLLVGFVTDSWLTILEFRQLARIHFASNDLNWNRSLFLSLLKFARIRTSLLHLCEQFNKEIFHLHVAIPSGNQTILIAM